MIGDCIPLIQRCDNCGEIHQTTEERWAMREAKRSRRISQLTLEAWA